MLAVPFTFRRAISCLLHFAVPFRVRRASSAIEAEEAEEIGASTYYAINDGRQPLLLPVLPKQLSFIRRAASAIEAEEAEEIVVSTYYATNDGRQPLSLPVLLNNCPFFAVRRLPLKQKKQKKLVRAPTTQH